MLTRLFLLKLTLLYLLTTNAVSQSSEPVSSIECRDTGCSGSYTGPEFIHGSDVAYQFSNSMSASVGDKLKELFDNKLYTQVDMSNIKMSTKGMGSGMVVYALDIPFTHVKERCDSYTSLITVVAGTTLPLCPQVRSS